MSVWYEYVIDVGSACGTGSVLVSEDATDDEVRLAIMNDLHDVTYEKSEALNDNEYEYMVDVGGGCGTGSVFVSEDATDDEILLAIMNNLYDVTYERRGAEVQEPEDDLEATVTCGQSTDLHDVLEQKARRQAQKKHDREVAWSTVQGSGSLQEELNKSGLPDFGGRHGLGGTGPEY